MIKMIGMPGPILPTAQTYRWWEMILLSPTLNALLTQWRRRLATACCSKSTRLEVLPNPCRRESKTLIILHFYNGPQKFETKLHAVENSLQFNFKKSGKNCFVNALMSYRCKMAQSNGWGVMVSHRSGETEDTFIADLVVGLCTGQVLDVF